MPLDIEPEDDRQKIDHITQPAFNLDELLEQVSPENLHIEVNTGDSIGNEAW